MRSFISSLILCLCAVEANAVLHKPALTRALQLLTPRTEYVIQLDIDPKKLKYTGHQKVSFTHEQPTPATYLLFFLYPNDPSITKAKTEYIKIANAKVNGAAARLEQSGAFAKVILAEPLSAGRPIQVEFDFEATIPYQKASPDLFTEALDELVRMFNPKAQGDSDYGIFSSTREILNLGLWYPILSKYDKEGWDEQKYSGMGDVSYFDPASFKVRIITDPTYRVVTTGSTLKKIPRKDGRMEHHIESAMTRDFEVELSAKYQEATRLQNRTVIRSFFLPEHRESGEIALEAGVKAFEYFEKVFGPYPYTELDIAEAPLFGGAGGVEFPGLVTISSMLYGTNASSEGDGLLRKLLADNPAFDQLLEFVVAHEVAHQWWNAVVGSNSKKHPFIDEAMANYSAVLYFEHYYDRPTAERMMAMQMKVNYQLHRLLGGADKPVMLPTSDFEGPMEYAAIVYGKGALYFDRLRKLIGDPAFFATTRIYYDTYWFKIAEPNDFTRISKQQAPHQSAEIDALFQRWMKERHGDVDIGPGTFDSLLKTVMAASPQSDSAPQLDNLLDQLNDLLNKEK